MSMKDKVPLKSMMEKKGAEAKVKDQPVVMAKPEIEYSEKPGEVMEKIEAQEVQKLAFPMKNFKVKGQSTGSVEFDKALEVTQSGFTVSKEGEINFSSDYLDGEGHKKKPIPLIHHAMSPTGLNPVEIIAAGLEQFGEVTAQTKYQLEALKAFCEEMVSVGITLDEAKGSDATALWQSPGKKTAPSLINKIKFETAKAKPIIEPADTAMSPDHTIEDKATELLSVLHLLKQLNIHIEDINFEVPVEKWPAARVNLTLIADNGDDAAAMLKAVTDFKKGVKV